MCGSYTSVPFLSENSGIFYKDSSDPVRAAQSTRYHLVLQSDSQHLQEDYLLYERIDVGERPADISLPLPTSAALSKIDGTARSINRGQRPLFGKSQVRFTR